MSELALKANDTETSYPHRTIDLIDDIHMSAWRVRGMGEAISLVRGAVPAIYDNSRESALVSASLHALDAEAETLDKLADTLFDRQVKLPTVGSLDATTQDPHAGWLKQWHEENERWHKAAQGPDKDHDEAEKTATENEKNRLGNLIGRTKALTLEGVLVQAEYWLLDFGGLQFGTVKPDVIEAATLLSIRDSLKAQINQSETPKTGDAS